MPIYSYKCESCAHQQELLRKLSDPPLSVCPACGAEAFVKQVTAAGFQLKGSGWYVTDFRGGNGGKKQGADAGGGDKSAVDKPAADKPADKPAEGAAASKPTEAAPAKPAAGGTGPAAASGGG
jgi:putative FmdB family regulatory protein